MRQTEYFYNKDKIIPVSCTVKGKQTTEVIDTCKTCSINSNSNTLCIDLFWRTRRDFNFKITPVVSEISFRSCANSVMHSNFILVEAPFGTFRFFAWQH